MAVQKSGKSAMPQLVVKIVGGKQIKNFVDASSSEEKHSPRNQINDEDLNRKSSINLEALRTEEHKEKLLAALRQAPDRQCVTAPCGDRSGSYIHMKTVSATTNNMTNTKQLFPESWLLSAVSEELQGLESQITENIEEEVIALDLSHSRIIHQSELTYLLLKHKIPLKLTTLACIFKSFSDTTIPEQVHYKELLQFIQRASHDKKHQGDLQAEIWHVSVTSTDLESVRERSNMTADQESWHHRFQKMEMAMQMCDTKNTDQAKRLLHNCSLIFHLNLSPLKINEVTRNSQGDGKVNLALALRLLKEL
ncbi:hypothetical protein IRJ41_015318 [Triplophysa rosa]|uniref:Uncharacterized protein n=1 Tax=Triplophysa rosa TaxID=992332 RepID=A0A9W7WC09_TRIRA|nr:hypothetical protein IRJ41_015318 [Triplophysa rosa]